jgi:hypothetical protein
LGDLSPHNRYPQEWRLRVRKKMKAVRVSRNGQMLFTAGLEDGILDARLIIRNQIDPVWFDVVGRDRSTGGHTRWAHVSVHEGDTFTMELVDVEASDINETRPGET